MDGLWSRDSSYICCMRKEEDIRHFTTSGGVRVIYAPTYGQITHAGIFAGAGSRNEIKSKHGLAHFTEHMLFKGTSRRSAYHLLSGIEHVGGEINAFTTKEETCIHASFPSAFLEKSLDILSDIMFHASFPEKEIEKEKDVVEEEIHYYRDNPDELIFDEFEKIVYGNHPLGHGVLGDEASVQSFSREDLQNFVRDNYTRDNIVLALSGAVNEQQLKKLCEKFFSVSPYGEKARGYSHPRRRDGEIHAVKRHVSQAHSIIGVSAPGYRHHHRFVMALLNNILGGPSNNSRLNYELREKRGLCYHAESVYQTYRDAGTWMAYTGCDPALHEHVQEVAMKEILKMKEVKMGTLQLQRAKQQLCGQILLSLETPLSVMISLGKSMLSYGVTKPVNETLQEIERITAADLMELAAELFQPERFHSLTYLPQS